MLFMPAGASGTASHVERLLDNTLPCGSSSSLFIFNNDYSITRQKLLEYIPPTFSASNSALSSPMIVCRTKPQPVASGYSRPTAELWLPSRCKPRATCLSQDSARILGDKSDAPVSAMGCTLLRLLPAMASKSCAEMAGRSWSASSGISNCLRSGS